VLEGTYPYVRGGVSSWVHDLIVSLPELRFTVVHIGAQRSNRLRRLYSLPANVVGLTDLYCREPRARGGEVIALERMARAERRRHGHRRRSARVLDGIRRLHLDEQIDVTLLDDLGGGDLTVGAFLHGRASFELTAELYQRLAPGSSFLDFFWHFRSMHLPLVRLLVAELPMASMYHAVCTGYAGALAAVWGQRTDRPFLLTEHGIYTRERRLELDRATWFRDGVDRTQRLLDATTAAALRATWTHFFLALARCAYARAATIVSLSEANRAKQIADGAPPERTLVVPNGIDFADFCRALESSEPGTRRAAP
jgi:glycosyltransferase involved in cell wall biosynthesis